MSASSTAKPETVPQTITTIYLARQEVGETWPVHRDANAQMQVVDGALVVVGDNGVALYAPGQWTHAYTRRNHG